mmetsp:Transcript_20694/g.50851  ORF Transcript_20694/g.50851 Transcript_20694/m.50851 type:complete len:298 (-) Transcript_20694:202-1095(-)
MVAPACVCADGRCDLGFWFLFLHVLPSCYLNTIFCYNWYMCVRGTCPEDAYSEEQQSRLLHQASPCSQSEDGEEGWFDEEAWHEGPGLRDVYGATRRIGALGTDGDPDRGHRCGTCKAFVIRCDHHCPCLGVCVGAHNQAYFVALMLSMLLSLVYASAMSLYATRVCIRQRMGIEECGALATTFFAATFLALGLLAFSAVVFILCCADITIREALSLDVFRFKAGPCFVWKKNFSNADFRKNLANVLGDNLWTLLVPSRRRPCILQPLKLPEEEDLAAAGVFWVVENGEERAVRSIR